MKFFVAYLCIFAGGSVGALSRFGIQEACRKWTRLPGWGAIFIATLLTPRSAYRSSVISFVSENDFVPGFDLNLFGV